MSTIEIMPRTENIAQLVQACAEGRLSFETLCSRVAAMGYRTTSLHEMVLAAERRLRARCLVKTMGNPQ